MGINDINDFQQAQNPLYSSEQCISMSNIPSTRSLHTTYIEVRPCDAPETVQPTSSKRGLWLSGLLGYRKNLLAYAGATGAVLLFNIIWLIWARTRYGLEGEVGTISEGTCAATQKLDSNLHAVINFLSTIVLTASTTFMHIAYSPSRGEVDAAHTQHRCLCVGSLGFRNLKHLSWRKILVYLVLMASSSPFHLL